MHQNPNIPPLTASCQWLDAPFTGTNFETKALFLQGLSTASRLRWTLVAIGGNGGTAGTRTQDQSLKRALLYQLSYRPKERKARIIAELLGQFTDITP